MKQHDSITPVGYHREYKNNPTGTALPMITFPNTSQEIDAAIKTAMLRHQPHAGDETGDIWCGADYQAWPCSYVVLASITLKLTAVATILQADQAAIIQGIVNNGNTSSQGKR